MIHPMESVYVWYIPEPLEKQMPPKVGQDDLFVALKVELGYALI